ncbi:MAG: hypothetical protein WCR33_06495 [Bacilli bacterium]
MIVLTGPSASGKTSIVIKLVKNYGYSKVITTTTRSPRVGEMDGVDYHFVSVIKFLKDKKNNEFIETIFYNGNYYGTTRSEISGKKVLIVDIKGANTFYEELGNRLTFCYIDAKDEIKCQRMQERGDSESTIRSRINDDKKVFVKENMSHIDFYIDTSDKTIDECAKEIIDKCEVKK